jgi:hypothetical protein
VDQVRVLGRVPDKEDGSVEKDPVQDALFGLQFDSETMDVTNGIGRTRLASDGGETDSGWNLCANLLEKWLRCDLAQVLGYLEVTVCAGSLGMDLRFSTLASK